MRFKSRKALAHQHTFVIDVHLLSPWPSLHGPLVIEYQRGSKRRGYSEAADPIDVGTGVTRYDWDASGRPQQFVIDATLYPVKGDKGGSLEQKLLNIYVCQLDEKGKPGNMVGGIVLDLAQLVGLPEHAVRQEYGVECSQSIVDMAGGRPKLVIGLSRRSSGTTKVNGHSEPQGGEKDGLAVAAGLAPLALDGDNEKIPSCLSTEIPSSERRMTGEEKSTTTVMSPNRAEVARRGFQAEHDVEPSASVAYDEDGFLVEEDEVHEEDEEDGGETDGTKGVGMINGILSRGVVGEAGEGPAASSPVTTRNLEEEFRRASVDEPDGEVDGLVGAAEDGDMRKDDFGKEEKRGMDPGHSDEGVLEKGDSVVPPLASQPDLSPFRASNQKPVHQRRFSRDINSSFGSARQLKGEDESRSGAAGSPSVASCGSAMKEVHGLNAGAGGKSHEREELEILAALEAAVWCAGYRRNTSSSRGQRSSPSKVNGVSNPHLTAARRLARTVIALGERQGLAFAERAVKSIRVACASSLGDVKRLVLWWAALITLRVRFFTLTEEDNSSGSSFFEWLKAVSPILSEAESSLYVQIVDNVWDAHVAPVLGDNESPENDDGTGRTEDSNTELDERIERLTSGLDAAIEALHSLTDASVSILKTLSRLVLEDVAVKLDVSLLKGRLNGTQGATTRQNASKRPIDSTTGLEIKMIVSKLVSYLESHGVEGAALPRMDSLSNVLVSHKASLLDAEVRRAIAPRISLNSILSVLHQYTMSEDEGTPEDLEKILDALQAKASTTVDLNATYEVLDAVEYTLPAEQTLSQQGIVQSLSLELSEESEDEIDELIGHARKGLLLELWGLTGK